MGVVRQVWAWSEYCQMVSQLHIKNELSYEVDKYIYLIFYIDIGVARKNYAWQKWFSLLSLQYVKTELSFDVDFCILVDIHKRSRLIRTFKVV